MTNLFKKPKAPEPFKPTAAQQELEREQLETRKEQSSEIAERQAKTRQRAYGRRSLLTGAATGVQEEKKETLG